MGWLRNIYDPLSSTTFMLYRVFPISICQKPEVKKKSAVSPTIYRHIVVAHSVCNYKIKYALKTKYLIQTQRSCLCELGLMAHGM